MKKFLRIVALLLATVLLTGCALINVKKPPVSFSCRDMTMNVPDGLKDVTGQSDYSSYAFALDSDDFAVLGINELFADYPKTEEYNTGTYAQMLNMVYGLNGKIGHREDNDYHYIVYTAEAEMGECTCIAGVFRSDKGFWIIQVLSTTEAYDQEESLSYLDSVKFSG